ncbi:MAG: acetyl-CoA carboxylase carboxyltransferase subunit alpha [Bacilli bacterium]
MNLNKENKIKEIKDEMQKLFLLNEKLPEHREKIIQLRELLNSIDSSSTKLTAWDKIQIARIKNRPTATKYIENVFDDFIELAGDRLYRDDKSIIGGIATLNGRSVTVIAQEKGTGTDGKIFHNFGMPHPEGYRKALRLIKQAEKFNRPVIIFVDTPGAYPGIEAEERGQGEAIARNLMELSNVSVPIITIIIGEGGSGGALGLAVADYVYILEYAVYSILSPEGFATILWKDASKAKLASDKMKLTATDLLKLNIVDEIIFEPTGGVQNNEEMVFADVKHVLVSKVNELAKVSKRSLVANRYKRFRNY